MNFVGVFALLKCVLQRVQWASDRGNLGGNKIEPALVGELRLADKERLRPQLCDWSANVVDESERVTQASA